MLNLANMPYETIIGLEIHIKPKTKSKMFCTCQNASDDLPPNTAICPICTGHPGTLPVVNRQAVEYGTQMSLAINCQIPTTSKFDRKSYFYPDLPKNYQISQLDKPVGVDGWLEIDTENGPRKIKIERLHLEEDAAKLIHSGDGTLIDFNRAGTPLMEIVTRPVIHSPQEAKAFLHELRHIARYIGVSEADMEKGQMRADANISLRPLIESGKLEDLELSGKVKLYPKTEIKNLNSFKAVERALEFEIARQTKLWDEGNPPQIQFTRGWDDAKQETYEQRSKEEANDYRYFPEPDIPPLKFGADVAEDSNIFDVQKISASLPELPAARRERFQKQYGFTSSDARLLIEEKSVANFTEEVVSELKDWLIDVEKSETKADKLWQEKKKDFAKLTAGWIINKLFKLLNEGQIEITKSKVNPENFAELMALIYQNKVNSSAAQTVLEVMFKTGADPSHVITDKGLAQESNEGVLMTAVEKAIKNNPGPVADYKKGATNAIQFLVGQVMKETKGKANPQVIQKLLKEKLV